MWFQIDWRDCNVIGPFSSPDVSFQFNVQNSSFTITNVPASSLYPNGENFTGSTANQWDVYGRADSSICFSPKITFTNKIGSASAGGTLTVAGVSQVSSGGSLNLTENQSFTVRTDQQFFPNWNNGGVTYEHNSWNGTLSEFRLPHGFTSNYGPNQTQDAMFLDIRPVSFATQLLDGGSGGIVKLNDPWWVDQYGNQPGNVFNAATSANVFLNQGDTLNLQPPYYSLLADPLQPISYGGQTYYWNLFNWSSPGASFQYPASQQTGVVFNAANATITANLKAHLASSNNAVTEAYGQRRMVNNSGTTTMLYESAGTVYSAASTGSNTWTAEAKASSDPGTKSNPALCNLRAVWLTYTPSSQYVINYSTMSGSWSSPVTIATVTDGSTRPVIGFSNARYVSYFDDYVGASMPIVAYKSDASTITVKRSTDGTTWYYDVFTHSSAVDNVSLSPYTSEMIPNTVVMVYEQNNTIQERESQGGIWGAQSTVPSSSGMAFHWGTLTSNVAKQPQVVRSGVNGYTHTDFVWHQTQTYLQYGTLDFIVQESWDDYGWYYWDAVAWQVTTPLSSPTIAPLSGNQLLLMWDESGTLKKVSGGYGTWGSVTTVGPGKNPRWWQSLVAHLPPVHCIWPRRTTAVRCIGS